ncbi:MAG: hypothetical protein B6240_14950 [Desulfobacteraceae bacterium 4572_87]|nr:MAG: hypothetical protein B6240_14950 [Desulfobacteraceae bacterium 4572_87]
MRVSTAWSDLMNWELCGQLHEDMEKIRPELGRTLAERLPNPWTVQKIFLFMTSSASRRSAPG